MKKMFAAGLETAEEALNVLEARLKSGEQAKRLERYSLAIRPGEVARFRGDAFDNASKPFPKPDEPSFHSGRRATRSFAKACAGAA